MSLSNSPEKLIILELLSKFISLLINCFCVIIFKDVIILELRVNN